MLSEFKIQVSLHNVEDVHKILQKYCEKYSITLRNFLVWQGDKVLDITTNADVHGVLPLISLHDLFTSFVDMYNELDSATYSILIFKSPIHDPNLVYADKRTRDYIDKHGSNIKEIAI